VWLSSVIPCISSPILRPSFQLPPPIFWAPIPHSPHPCSPPTFPAILSFFIVPWFSCPSPLPAPSSLRWAPRFWSLSAWLRSWASWSPCRSLRWPPRGS
jgi:hypothetical protein